MMKLAKKWLSIPMGIFIVSMSGSALNLSMRFGVVSNLAEDWVQQLMLVSVQFGYYSGIIAGALVDKLPNLITYLVAATPPRILTMLSSGVLRELHNNCTALSSSIKPAAE